MSRDASIDLDFGDGEHRFRLAIGELRELQEKTGASPFTVFNRLVGYEPRVDDCREVIRLGLIGGSLPPPEALTFVRRYVEGRPLAEPIPVATAILKAALFGVPDEAPGKSEGETEAAAPPPATP
jgi:hypothetical protein